MTTGLWTFSLAFYARPGVAPACLRCQDEAGADVNLVLFLLWQAGAGVRFVAGEITVIDQDVRAWREQVVQPLRAVRRYLKDQGQDDLRDRVKATELRAEQLEQDTLSRHGRVATGAPVSEAASANLDAYAIMLGRTLPPAARAALVAALIP
jgi:uncharacterized protein (TIGR02444 family)